jgi:hypothetical protein
LVIRTVAGPVLALALELRLHPFRTMSAEKPTAKATA